MLEDSGSGDFLEEGSGFLHSRMEVYGLPGSLYKLVRWIRSLAGEKDLFGHHWTQVLR